MIAVYYSSDSANYYILTYFLYGKIQKLLTHQYFLLAKADVAYSLFVCLFIIRYLFYVYVYSEVTQIISRTILHNKTDSGVRHL